MLERSAEDLASCDGFSVSTDIGSLDVIWDPGVDALPAVKAASEPIVLGEGEPCLVLGLDALIEAKRSMGRTRDLIAVEELEEMRRRRREQTHG